ncbi:Anion-transporting ATPase [Musa troglodytarum]|uniref:Anion-transporting ATPase n=1 Tax=Musa troglodytarum TaxID=320322 RepID=A0A9E7KAE5_9LILI|nr:Anion-transporting ATPase [Musa troglodytarum]
MALLVPPPFSSTPTLSPQNPNAEPLLRIRRGARPRRRSGAPVVADSRNPPQKPTRLVTFLGKGGSGKTTAAVLAAQYYAMEGLKTCLLVHSQDPTVEKLMGCRIGSSPRVCDNNVSVVRLETSKMLLEPLDRMKKVDARLNLTQGVLEGVVGEELGVLPGMDSIFSALTLQKMVNFVPGERRSLSQREFDVIVYDGMSTEETLRLIGTTDRARWYLKYMRNMAEKTDIGRLTAPSLLKLAYESIRLYGGSIEDKTSVEIWDDIERVLEKTSVSFADSSKFGCYLVMDTSRSTSVDAALRYWGCAIQAGTDICGVLGFSPTSSVVTESIIQKFLPLRFGCLPYISSEECVDLKSMIESLNKDTKDLFGTSSCCSESSVRFDPSQKSVTLFMPVSGRVRAIGGSWGPETRNQIAFFHARKGRRCEIHRQEPCGYTQINLEQVSVIMPSISIVSVAGSRLVKFVLWVSIV